MLVSTYLPYKRLIGKNDMGIKTIIMASMLLIVSVATNAADKPMYYGLGLCDYPDYKCIKVARGQTWEKLFPDETQRDLVQRVNRTYNYLWAGKEIVVPRNLDQVTLFDLSPFPLKIDPLRNRKQIIVDQEKLAWGAYDANGQLVKWGPVSSGSDKCSDNSSPTCRTQTGVFDVFSKENEKCKSNMFPLGRGGAKMPYCMYFHKGLALHGSNDIPGYRASHGCVRMFVQDAKWLNHEFVEISDKENNFTGTIVVIRPLSTASAKTKVKSSRVSSTAAVRSLASSEKKS